MIFEIAVIISVILFIAAYLLIFFLTDTTFSGRINYHQRDSIKFSVIIAAKNETDNLPDLISALRKLNYSSDYFEVIIVDDYSQDNTYVKATELLRDIENFRIVRPVEKILDGKRGALSYGISLASFPNIVITDADCVPPQDWLQHLSQRFEQDYDFIFGIAPYFQTKSLVNKISCFENFRNTIISIAALKLALPYTAAARNFAFRKKAFEFLGGYKNTSDTISGDDDLLLREALKHNLKIGAVTAKGSFVYSHSKSTFKEYFSQRARHTQTSFHYLTKQKIFLSVWHLMNIFLLLSPLLAFFNILFILPFTVKLLHDLLTGIYFQNKIGYRFSIIEIIYLQIIYESFLLVHFFRAKFGRISWK